MSKNQIYLDWATQSAAVEAAQAQPEYAEHIKALKDLHQHVREGVAVELTRRDVMARTLGELAFAPRNNPLFCAEHGGTGPLDGQVCHVCAAKEALGG